MAMVYLSAYLCCIKLIAVMVTLSISVEDARLAQFLALIQQLGYAQIVRMSALPVQPQAAVAANREAILAMAGSWGDFSEEEFQEMRAAMKATGEDLFNRDTTL